MRAHTEGKDKMGKRFAIVIGVAAAGVMALGAQTTLAGGDRAPDLQLSGPKKQSQGIGPECTDRCGPRAVEVDASCGVASGPPVSWHERDPVPPANLPDLGCHLSAEGKVMGARLRPAHADIPGPHVACYGTVAPYSCNWQSGFENVLLEPELRKKTRTQVRNALEDGKMVRAKVTVEARKAGNVATAKRTIKLVK
jgi:hypothetical protein